MPKYPVINTGNETIPPFALMKQSGIDINNNGAIKVVKPDADSLQGLLINGPTSIEPNDIGQGDYENDCVIYLDKSGAFPSDGGRHQFGSKKDSWGAYPGGSGFVVYGERFGGTANAIRATGAPQSPNYLVNGSYYFAQRNTLTTGDMIVQSGNFAWDRFYIVSEANITYRFNQPTPGTGIEGTRSYGIFRQNSGSNKGLLALQVIEKEVSQNLKNVDVTFAFSTRATAGNITVKGAIFEWTGSGDNTSIKTGLVTGWANNTPTFSTSNYIQLGNATVTANSTAWSNITLVGTPDSSTSNLLIAIWGEAVPTGNGIQLAKTGLFSGTYTAWSEPDYSIEWLRCARFYWKPTFYNYPAVANSKATTFVIESAPIQMPTTMRTPNIAVTSPYTTIGASANATQFVFQEHSTGNFATGNSPSISRRNFYDYTGLDRWPSPYIFLAVSVSGSLGNVGNGNAGYLLGIDALEFNCEI